MDSVTPTLPVRAKRRRSDLWLGFGLTCTRRHGDRGGGQTVELLFHGCALVGFQIIGAVDRGELRGERGRIMHRPA